MAPDRLANTCKNNKPYSRRPTGKAMKRWKDNHLLTTTTLTETKKKNNGRLIQLLKSIID